MERGAMKHRLTAGVRDVDALLRVAWQKGEVSNGPMERAELRSLGHASLRWGLGMCPGSWQGSKGGRAGESLGGVLPLCQPGLRGTRIWVEKGDGSCGHADEEEQKLSF